MRPDDPEELSIRLGMERAKGRPLAYVLQSQGFFKHEFYCDERVLIPRPESELLVELLLKSFSAQSPCHVAEVGVGSGCIALSFLAQRPLALVTGTDISQDALDVASLNAHRMGLVPRFQLCKGSVLEPLSKSPPVFDAIVSNPPYIARNDASVDPAVHAYEPHVALYTASERDALAVVRLIIEQAKARLVRGGLLAIEVGWKSAQETVRLFEASGYSTVQVIKDFSNIERIVSGRLC